MKLHEPYVPKLHKNLTAAAASGLFCAAVTGLWIFRKRLFLETGDLLILSGAAAFALTLNIISYRKKKENYQKSRELCDRQKGIGEDSGSGIFY